MSVPSPVTVTEDKAAARRVTAVVGVLSLAVFMSSLDLFIVNLAFPYIARQYPGTSLSSLSWVLNAYTIVFAAVLVPAGRWADRIGRRRMFVAGLAGFTRRLGAVRAGAGRGRADRGAGHPGGRGRGDGARVAVPAAGRGPAGRPAEGAGHLVGAGRAGRRARPGDRRQPGPGRTGAGCSGSTCRSGWRPWCWPSATVPESRDPSASGPPGCARGRFPRRGRRPGGARAGGGAELGLGLGRLPRLAGRRAGVRRGDGAALAPASFAGPGARAAALADVQRRVRGLDLVLRRVRRVRAQRGGVPHRGVALLRGGGRAGHRARAADGAAVRPAGRAAAGGPARRARAGRGDRLPGQRRRAAGVAVADPGAHPRT